CDAYGENSISIRYRTWTSGSGWGAQFNGPDIGAVPNSMVFSSDPSKDYVVLMVQDSANDLHFLDSHGASYVLETNTGETKNQPFLFLFDQGNNVDTSGNALWLSTTGTDLAPGMPGVNSV